MEDKYYIRIRGEIRGPFPIERLHGLARRGKFGQHHHVSLDGITWESAADHPELFPITPQQMPESIDTLGDELGGADHQNDFLSGSQSPTEEQQWYYTREGTQQGPVSLSELKNLAATGQLKFDDFLFTESMSDWVLASSVSGIFPSNDSMEIPFSIDTSRSFGQNASRHRSSNHIPTAPMAVASFVLGLLGVCFPFLVISALMDAAGKIVLKQINSRNILLDVSLLFLVSSILAIIFGHIALKQIDSSNASLGGRKIAIAGLVLGYSIIGICITSVFVLFFIAGHLN